MTSSSHSTVGLQHDFHILNAEVELKVVLEVLKFAFGRLVDSDFYEVGRLY